MKFRLLSDQFEKKKHEFITTQWQMLSIIFDSVHFSWNFITGRLFCPLSILYTQIKFSISITSIYTGFK